jgi:hypothetical protein
MMLTDSVGDTEGTFVPARELGQFNVTVPNVLYFANMDTNPGWTFQGLWQYGAPNYSSASAPKAGFTGASIIAYNLSGNYENRLPGTFATTPVVDCSSSAQVTLKFRRWLRLRNSDSAMIQASTNGTSWVTVWSTTKTTSDEVWQEVQYSLPAFVAGSANVRLRWGIASGSSGNDIGWNIDDVMVLGDGVLDTALPVAAINVPNIVTAGSPVHTFTVTYTDNVAVNVTSLGSGDLYVLGPNGFSNLVEFAGADLAINTTPIAATYTLAAPNSVWSPADNGQYQVYLAASEVSDAANNELDETLLGSFTVAIITPLSIDSITGNAGNIDLTVAATLGFTYTLQSTTDFETWTDVETKIAIGSTVNFTTPETDETARFYRIKN